MPPAIAFLLRSNLQPAKVLTKGIANQRRAILFLQACGSVGLAKERFVEDDLDGFHMWTLFHSILHN